MLLADQRPERRVRLLAMDQQDITARVICGIHSPSALAAGQHLASAALEQMLSSDQWQWFKASVQLEVKALPKPPSAGLPQLYD